MTRSRRARYDACDPSRVRWHDAHRACAPEADFEAPSSDVVDELGRSRGSQVAPILVHVAPAMASGSAGEGAGSNTDKKHQNSTIVSRTRCVLQGRSRTRTSRRAESQFLCAGCNSTADRACGTCWSQPRPLSMRAGLGQNLRQN